MPDLLLLKEQIVLVVEFTGVVVILAGGCAAVVTWIRDMRGGASDHAYRDFRRNLGRAILLGLEFLVAADIINTVAIRPDPQDVLVLAGIVLIRTFLSFSLEVEITGRWPWRRGNGAPRGPHARRAISPSDPE